jgi:hypothetical protein
VTARDILIYAAIGFGVWLSGAVEFRYGGRFLFENGPWAAGLSAVFIAVAVCWIFRSVLRWRHGNPRDGVTVAVAMALPGLFGEALRQLLFGWSTGLKPGTQPVFAATLFLGNAVLLAYSVWFARRA